MLRRCHGERGVWRRHQPTVDDYSIISSAIFAADTPFRRRFDCRLYAASASDAMLPPVSPLSLLHAFAGCALPLRRR